MNTSPVTDLETTYRTYIAAYPKAVWRYLTEGIAIDYDALKLWTFPLLVISAKEAAAFIGAMSEADFDRIMRSKYEDYFADGWVGRVELDDVTCFGVTETIGVIESRGTRYRADGSVIDRWDSCYVACRRPSGWKVIMLTDAQRPRPTSAQWREWIALLPLDVRDSDKK